MLGSRSFIPDNYWIDPPKEKISNTERMYLPKCISELARK